jgi:hypothetical protein
MVVLLVDALGDRLAHAHADFAPGLPHRRPLETILGFSSGALPTLFTGRMPREHGRWLMYRRANGTSPFRGFGAVRALPPSLQRSGRLTRFLSRVVARRGVRGYFHLYEVPRWLLPAFDLPERDDIFSPGGLPGGALWDTLERRGVPWRGWNWRTSEAENLEAAARAAAGGDARLVFCYTAELDATLHREGSRGAGVAAAIERYGRWIARVLDEASGARDPVWLYLLSDHGMVDVSRTLDVMGILDTLEPRWPRDYLAFFDSTMARFWWRDAAARDAVRGRLARERGGRWLSRDELARAGADFADAAYGDDVFLLDPGVLLVPSFMGRSPLSAMHGYDAEHPDMTALLWSNRPIPDGVRHLRDVRGFLESELDAARGAA